MRSTYIVGVVVFGGFLAPSQAQANDSLELGRVRVEVTNTKVANLKGLVSQAALARLGQAAGASFRVELHVTRSAQGDTIGYEVSAVIVDAKTARLRHVVKAMVRAKIYARRPIKSSRIEIKAALAATNRAVADALHLIDAQYAMVTISPDSPKRSTT